MSTNSLPILQNVFNRECISYAQYLSESWPWASSDNDPAMSLVRQIIEQERAWAQETAELIEQRNGVALRGNYPTAFTDQHFIAIDFAVEQLRGDLQRSIAYLERCLGHLAGDPEARELLEKMIRGKKSQLESLDKVRTPVAE